ncbi:hypothetical protein BN1002_00815 [Bacillus sp. B-jedd]|nr:hypothetical protein BN1002_00815 [Bacillus sp. B-jedd]
MHSPVKITYLTEEELAIYRSKPTKLKEGKLNRAIDWRWPQNRRRDEDKLRNNAIETTD